MLCSALPTCSRHQEGVQPARMHVERRYKHTRQAGVLVERPTSPTTSAHVPLQEDAHILGCTAVSWCPATPAGSLVSGKPVTQPVSRLVTAGCDNTLRVGLLALSAIAKLRVGVLAVSAYLWWSKCSCILRAASPFLKVWQLDSGSHKWREQAALSGHSDWVRDAAWAPNLGLPMSTIASCGQDGQVLVWSEGEKGWSKQVTQVLAACQAWALLVVFQAHA